MLILSRKVGESIVIDGRITVKIMRLDGDLVKVGIEAPAEVPVHRQEVFIEIQQNNQEAVTNAKTSLPRLATSVVSLPVAGNNSTSPDSSPSSAPFVPKIVMPATRE
jgi:carbon storage regulator